MPLNYNFAFKNSKLRQWERPKPKNILASEKTLKERILYLYQLFFSNPEITFPPGLILIITFVGEFVSGYINQETIEILQKTLDTLQSNEE